MTLVRSYDLYNNWWLICKDILHDSLRYIIDYATSYTKDSVYIIGGRWKSGSSSSIPTIAQFKDNEWTIAGSLKQPRHGHGAITVNERTMIFGGSGSYTELFEYESFETEEIEPKLNRYYYPGLFFVEDGFCSKNLNQSNPEPWFIFCLKR